MLEELGRGEYGQVFRVKNKKDQQIYALKKVNIASAHVPFSQPRKNKKYRPSEKSKHSNSSNTQISSTTTSPFCPWTTFISSWSMLPKETSPKYSLPELDRQRAENQREALLRARTLEHIYHSCQRSQIPALKRHHPQRHQIGEYLSHRTRKGQNRRLGHEQSHSRPLRTHLHKSRHSRLLRPRNHPAPALLLPSRRLGLGLRLL